MLDELKELIGIFFASNVDWRTRMHTEFGSSLFTSQLAVPRIDLDELRSSSEHVLAISGPTSSAQGSRAARDGGVPPAR
jgi:hypothetical protein